MKGTQQYQVMPRMRTYELDNEKDISYTLKVRYEPNLYDKKARVQSLIFMKAYRSDFYVVYNFHTCFLVLKI